MVDNASAIKKFRKKYVYTCHIISQKNNVIDSVYIISIFLVYSYTTNEFPICNIKNSKRKKAGVLITEKSQLTF